MGKLFKWRNIFSHCRANTKKTLTFLCHDWLLYYCNISAMWPQCDSCELGECLWGLPCSDTWQLIQIKLPNSSALQPRCNHTQTKHKTVWTLVMHFHIYLSAFWFALADYTFSLNVPDYCKQIKNCEWETHGEDSH